MSNAIRTRWMQVSLRNSFGGSTQCRRIVEITIVVGASMLIATSALAGQSPCFRFSPTPCPTSEEQIEGERAAALHYRNTLIELGGTPTRAIRETPSRETKHIGGVLHYRNPEHQTGWEIVQNDLDCQHRDHWYDEKRQFSDELELWKTFRDYQRRARESQLYTSARNCKQRCWDDYQRHIRGYWCKKGWTAEIDLSQNEQQQTKLVTWMEYEVYQDTLNKQLRTHIENLQQTLEFEKQKLEERYNRPIDLICHDPFERARERSEDCPELSQYSHAKRKLHYGPFLEVEKAETRLKWIQQQISYLFAGSSDRHRQSSTSYTERREDIPSSPPPSLSIQCKRRSIRCGTLGSSKISKPTRPQPRRSQRHLSKTIVNIASTTFQDVEPHYIKSQPDERSPISKHPQVSRRLTKCAGVKSSPSSFLIGPISSRLRSRTHDL